MSEELLPCVYCEGSGYTVESEAACCGHASSIGECCGNAIEVQRQLACEACGGSGKLSAITILYIRAQSVQSEENDIIYEAQFLLDRLSELDWSLFTEDISNEWYGHVIPSMTRLQTALSSRTQVQSKDDAYARGAREGWKRCGVYHVDIDFESRPELGEELDSRWPLATPPIDKSDSAGEVLEKVARAIWNERRNNSRMFNKIELEPYDTSWGEWKNIAYANNILEEAKAAISAYEAAHSTIDKSEYDKCIICGDPKYINDKFCCYDCAANGGKDA